MPDTDDNTPGTNPEIPTSATSDTPVSADETAAPRRRRRAASRPAGSPASAADAGTTEGGAAAAPSADEAAADGAAPARTRRRVTRKAADAAPDTEAAGADAPVSEDDAAAARPRRRAARKATAAAGAPAEAAENAENETAPADEDAAASRPRRRASRKATAAAGAPDQDTASAAEAPSADEPAAEDSAAPTRARRRATRKATAPAGPPSADSGEIVVESAPATTADAPVAAADEPAADSAAPTRARRRATRKAAAPAEAPAAESGQSDGSVAATTDEPADIAPAADTSAAPTRARRRATRNTAAPAEAPAAEAQIAAAPEADSSADAAPARGRRRAARETAAEDEPRTRGRKSASSAGGGRRGKKADTMVPTFSAGEGSRRLKPGALAPREGGAPTTYRGKALRDGDGWGVEIDDAYEIRGYGETLEEATEEAAAALAAAFGVPVEAVSIDVRPEDTTQAAQPAKAQAAPPAAVEQDTEEEPAPTRGRRRATRPAVAVFQPPVFQAADPAQAQAVEQAAAEPEPGADTDTDTEADADEDRSPRRRRRRRGGAPEQPAAPADEPEVESAQDAESDADGEDADSEDTDGEDRPSRRRRRGGRRRRRGDSAEHEQDHEQDEHGSHDEDESRDQDAESEDDNADDEDAGGGSSSSSRRRRRRRRRGSDAGEQDANDGGDDPERTVVKVREPRGPRLEGGTGVDEVQSIKGSTRLEAKKQRRREGREQGRRRVPIITEAEFLARREAVERVMVVRQNGERTQIGVLEDNVLVEHYVNKEQATSYVGNVYLGKVQNVLPSMEAAFVDIGKGRNAVLYAGEVNFEALGHSGGPRRIEAALKSGQPVLVQVTKDPIGHKGARLTSQVSLPGRYLVYVPEGSMTGISRKLPDTERARLKTILKKIVPEDAGVIVRTAAEGASEDELRRDVERLQSQWEDISRKAKTGNAPTLLYGEPDMTVRVVRDIFNEDFSKVIVSGDEAWDTVHEYVSHVAPDLVDRLSRWTSEVDVFATFRIDEQLLKALDRKVWLPSGGSLVIDKTEAMVVVDVNTGKFTGQGGNLEETVTRNNLEAAEEIVRQLRLRDLGGIVVIDFIDMVLESNRDLVMRRLLECLGRDRTKHQVAEVTSLGLVQMTRKRVGQGLLESFSETCVHCNGRGVIVHMDQATTTGGGGKRKRRRGANGAGEGHEHEHEAVAEIEEPGDELPELEPIEVGESDLVPAVGDPEEEWFGSAAEAEAAMNNSRGRGGRRRGSRKATAPAGAPPAADHEPERAVLVVPVSEPDVEPVELPESAAEVSTEPPARTRRRATRKATAPAGSPAAAQEAAVVVVSAEPAVVPEPEHEVVVSTEPPVRARRRATRKVAAPAGSPAAAQEAAVVVVPTSSALGGADADAGAADGAEPKKRAARKAPAKKAAAKKTAKKAAAKKTTAKKASSSPKKAVSSSD